MQLGKEELREAWESDKRKNRTRMLMALAITIAVFIFCISFRYNPAYYSEKFIPQQYFKAIVTAIQLGVAKLTGSMNSYEIGQAIEEIDPVIFWGALAQIRLIFVAFVSGGALSLAGAVFQTIYRNPMASPNMLGATAGVKLGNILMISLYSSAALQLTGLRYKYCYILTAFCVVGVLILGKLAGRDKKKTVSVMGMIMAGSVVSQGLNVFTQYFMYELEEEDLLIYQKVNMGTYLQLDALSMVLFSSVMAIAIIPMLILRYRFNSTALDETESIAAGVNPAWPRFIGQICGVLMVTAAMIHCGEIGMISMVIPYAIRAAVGADFKKVCVYSLLAGGCLVMLCRLVSTLILMAGEAFPVSFIINIILAPVFMAILAKQRRYFD